MAKSKKNNNLLIVGLVVLIVGMTAAVIIRNQNKPKGEKVAVEKVQLRTIVERVAASGKVFPQTEVKISSDVSGEIVELYVEEGDSVTVNQVLAKIDPDAYQSQVERGAASVNSTKAQLANARSQVENLIAQKEQIQAQLTNAREIYDRNKKLREDGVISEADYETSRSNLKALEANLRSSEANIKAAQESVRAAQFSVKSAEATLKELRTSLNRTTIYAPMSGTISRLDVEKGERVVGTIQMQGTEMMRIANLNAMEVRVEVSENDVPRVSIGDQVEIEVDAYLDRKFAGKVTQIANSAINTGVTNTLTSDQVTNFEVRINIDPESYADLIAAGKIYPFRPGMSASVEILTEREESVNSVPIQAVTTRDKDKDKKKEKKELANGQEKDEQKIDYIEVVFVVSSDTIRMAEVNTGIQDDSYIQILTGLSVDEEVVVAPYSAISRKLEGGDRVQVVPEDKLFSDKD